jgi:hypothetical protein
LKYFLIETVFDFSTMNCSKELPLAQGLKFA